MKVTVIHIKGLHHKGLYFKKGSELEASGQELETLLKLKKVAPLEPPKTAPSNPKTKKTNPET